jgi:hypothetical protein
MKQAAFCIAQEQDVEVEAGRYQSKYRCGSARVSLPDEDVVARIHFEDFFVPPDSEDVCSLETTEPRTCLTSTLPPTSPGLWAHSVGCDGRLVKPAFTISTAHS